MSAGLRAHDLGSSVLLVEKGPSYGGSSAMSGGVCWVGDNPHMKRAGIPDSEAETLDYLRHITKGEASDAHLETYVRESKRMVGYFADNTHLTFDALAQVHRLLPGGSGREARRALDGALPFRRLPPRPGAAEPAPAGRERPGHGQVHDHGEARPALHHPEPRLDAHDPVGAPQVRLPRRQAEEVRPRHLPDERQRPDGPAAPVPARSGRADLARLPGPGAGHRGRARDRRGRRERRPALPGRGAPGRARRGRRLRPQPRHAAGARPGARVGRVDRG